MDSMDFVIVRELRAFDPAVVYRFGSTATGRARSDSDVDVAFFARPSPDPYDVFIAAQRIAAAIGRDVDLVDLGRGGDVMKAQVIGTGRRIFVGDEYAKDVFEMLALSGYARLNEERREILARRGFR